MYVNILYWRTGSGVEEGHVAVGVQLEKEVVMVMFFLIRYFFWNIGRRLVYVTSYTWYSCTVHVLCKYEVIGISRF